MYQSNQYTRNRLVGNLINQSIWRRVLLLGALAFVIGWLALSPSARALCREGCTGVGGTYLGDGAITRHYETAIGNGALQFGVHHISNTANGGNALIHITTGNANVAVGSHALYANESGSKNTAIGAGALFNNRTGNRNVAAGYRTLFSNQIGNFNTAIGFRALYQNTGSNNVGLGFNAGSNLTTGDENLCIGYNVFGRVGESNTTRISNIYSSAASARLVYVDSDNKIGTLVSSRRFKEDIKPMENSSAAILALKPVTFHYKKASEPNGGIMFGLIAEDVEKVDPDLVTRNDKGQAETVRYEAINAMLLNEFLKQHRKLEEQGCRLAEQGRIIEKHQAEIRALALQIQKVSAQMEVNKQALRMISSNK